MPERHDQRPAGEEHDQAGEAQTDDQRQDQAELHIISAFKKGGFFFMI